MSFPNKAGIRERCADFFPGVPMQISQASPSFLSPLSLPILSSPSRPFSPTLFFSPFPSFVLRPCLALSIKPPPPPRLMKGDLESEEGAQKKSTKNGASLRDALRYAHFCILCGDKEGGGVCRNGFRQYFGTHNTIARPQNL